MREGKLTPISIERIGWSKSKNRFIGWFVRAYRIVDGKDMIQPYLRTKCEAREDANKLGIQLVE